MDHALALFAEKGIIDTSVQQITEQCGISKGAFYLVFKSKDELINALVDQFMIRYISDIDYLVKHEEKDNVLKAFLVCSYQFSKKHRAFSNVYVKEQMHKMNETMFERLRFYDRAMNESLFTLVNKLYENKSINEKYELVYMIKSFMQLYQMFTFQMEKEIDIDHFIEAIIEKIELIATYSTQTFITDEMRMFLEIGEMAIDKALMINKMNLLLEEVEDDIVQQSIVLLRHHLENETLEQAVVQGLIHNLQNHPLCKEISYLYLKYIGK